MAVLPLPQVLTSQRISGNLVPPRPLATSSFENGGLLRFVKYRERRLAVGFFFRRFALQTSVLEKATSADLTVLTHGGGGSPVASWNG